MSKTIILSDIHFGKTGSTVGSAHQLRGLWEGCESLILNGDSTEAHSANSSEKTNKLCTELLQLAKEDGVRTIMIAGNHDPEISKINSKWFWDNRVLVFHGHAVFPGVAPWSWRAPFIHQRRIDLARERGNGFEEQLEAVREASLAAAMGEFNHHRPSPLHMASLALPASFRVLLSWWRFPKMTSNWVNQFASSAKFIIVGHTHHAGIWEVDGRVIINTGCFGFPSHPRAVIIDEDELTVYRLRLLNNQYTLGRVYSSWKAR
jgi:predicted phosphodiesterase